MPRRNSYSASLAFLIATLASCGPAIPAHRVVQLPSGRQLKILEIDEHRLEDGTAGLRFAYETDLDLEDRRALYLEVEAIWEEFRSTKEAAGKSVVAIKATTPEAPGWSRERAALEYRLQRTPDGSWHFVNSARARAAS